MQKNEEVLEAPLLIRRDVKLMGNRFEFTVVSHDERLAEESIDAAISEVKRIEALLTTFNESSQTNLVNRHAGICPVKVDRELIQLLQRCYKLSELTQGAFDITYGSVDKRLWNFDQGMKYLPSAAEAKKKVKLINYRKVICNEESQTVFLEEKGMRIGFGGIGKGYAADMAKAVLQQKGIKSGIVNAAGDLTAWGLQPTGLPWTIGIADPDSKHHPFSSFNITNTSVATSGNYEKYITINGKRYSHTIDPKTGLPVSGIKSVTIFSPGAELADAMATPVMIMGKKVGLDLINQVNGLGCIIIDDDNKIFTSKNINLR